jgi:hypothetical protein
MAKIRLTFVIVKEYEPNPVHYSDGDTINDMLNCDLGNANDDPHLIIGDDADWTITGEIIE